MTIGMIIETAISTEATMTKMRRLPSLSDSLPATSTARIVTGTPASSSSGASAVASAWLSAGRT